MESRDARDLRHEAGDFINVGPGRDITVKELAEIIREAVYADMPGVSCQINWDTSKPNGTFRKVTDVSRLNTLGFRCETNLRAGIAQTYKEFVADVAGAGTLRTLRYGQ